MTNSVVTDENNEIVEMPLRRSQRRRLQQSGAPNPWHVVQPRRGGADRTE